jgi:plasmid stabilization system protein ParE
MSLPLIVTPEAEEDIAEARAWYNRQRAGLGDDFVDQVDAALDRICRIPKGATEVYPGVRRVVLRRFPYGAFYRVDEDQIAVLAVYHSKRDPRGWQSRMHH